MTPEVAQILAAIERIREIHLLWGECFGKRGAPMIRDGLMREMDGLWPQVFDLLETIRNQGQG